MRIGCAYLVAISRFGFPPRPKDNLTAIEDVASAGFDGIEFEAIAGLNLEGIIQLQDKIRDSLIRHNLDVASFTAVIPELYSSDTGQQAASLATFEKMAELANALGTSVIDFCPYLPSELAGVAGSELYLGGPPTRISPAEGFSWDRFWNHAVDTTARCSEIAAKYELKMAIEGRIGDFVATTDGVLGLLAKCDPKITGVLLDLAHVHAAKEYLELVIPKLGKRILHVHIADNLGDQAYHLPMGEGNIDFSMVINLLRQVGYEGYLCVDLGGVDHVWEKSVGDLKKLRSLLGLSKV
ncbi:MAG: sugar phosphate isomerase/epimerase [Firmicutes bacterium]|nr:sugar phosphate isomerase/epimerase [Bacillota bacterium]